MAQLMGTQASRQQTEGGGPKGCARPEPGFTWCSPINNRRLHKHTHTRQLETNKTIKCAKQIKLRWPGPRNEKTCNAASKWATMWINGRPADYEKLMAVLVHIEYYATKLNKFSGKISSIDPFHCARIKWMWRSTPRTSTRPKFICFAICNCTII